MNPLYISIFFFIIFNNFISISLDISSLIDPEPINGHVCFCGCEYCFFPPQPDNVYCCPLLCDPCECDYCPQLFCLGCSECPGCPLYPCECWPLYHIQN